MILICLGVGKEDGRKGKASKRKWRKKGVNITEVRAKAFLFNLWCKDMHKCILCFCLFFFFYVFPPSILLPWEDGCAVPTHSYSNCCVELPLKVKGCVHAHLSKWLHCYTVVHYFITYRCDNVFIVAVGCIFKCENHDICIISSQISRN